MKKIVNVLAIIALSFSLIGCLPRGETKTLDQVFRDAQSKFQNTSVEAVPAPARPLLDQVVLNVGKLTANGASFATVSGDLATAIRGLIPYSGYTSRASFAELASQLEQVPHNKGFDAAAAKLIAARIYSALTIEVSTTHFGVSPA